MQYDMTRIRLPHSEIPGSKLALSSPRLIAEFYVLLRYWLSRHPLSVPLCTFLCINLFSNRSSITKKMQVYLFFSSLSKLLNETLRTRRFYVFLQRERLKDYLSSQYFSSSQWLTRSTCLTCSHCSTIFLLLQHFFVIFLKNLSIGLVRRPYRRESSAIEPRYQCVRPLLNGANSDHLSLDQRSWRIGQIQP